MTIRPAIHQMMPLIHHALASLADPANLPHNAKIKLGEETLDLKVSAIMDEAGAYLGPMVTWAVITRQVALWRRRLG